MSKISIVIPVYNAEKYLSECIDSVVNQSFSDFECIFVDDCSQDKSAEICENIVQKDKRFMLIRKQENSGNLETRKKGIAAAKGEFIVHIDNDDWIESNMLELLIEKQNETNADVIIGGFRMVGDNFMEEYLFPKILSEISPLEYFFYTKCRVFWGKLVKRELYDNLIVPPRSISIGDDAMYNTQVFAKLLNTSQIAIVDIPVYNWRIRNNSITHTTLHSYKSYLEDPRIGCRMWIEDYLISINAEKKVMDAFRFYMIEEGVVENFVLNRQLSQKDARLLYKKYFIPFSYKNKLPRHYRLTLKTFNISVTLGRFYLFARNILIKIKTFLLRK